MVFGKGVNDLVGESTSEYYITWYSMLRRCYSPVYKERYPTYKGCMVCDEWLVFSKFKSWMETQNWQGKHLDKDILLEGNKVYSPVSCVFLPKEINLFFLDRKNARGDLPLGVTYRKRSSDMKNELKNCYVSRCQGAQGKRVSLGCYPCEKVAHFVYLEYKLEVLKELVSEQEDKLIVIGLNRILDKITFHLENKILLESY